MTKNGKDDDHDVDEEEKGNDGYSGHDDVDDDDDGAKDNDMHYKEVKMLNKIAFDDDW